MGKDDDYTKGYKDAKSDSNKGAFDLLVEGLDKEDSTRSSDDYKRGYEDGKEY